MADVDNGDGTWTFTQLITAAATPPHYEGPFYGPSNCASSAEATRPTWGRLKAMYRQLSDTHGSHRGGTNGPPL